MLDFLFGSLLVSASDGLKQKSIFKEVLSTVYYTPAKGEIPREIK
jgi:hypothetical protein